MIKAKRRGTRSEVTLVNLLEERGYYAIRIPCSGNPKIPDVIGAKNGKRFAFAVKSTKSKRYRVKEDDLLSLLDFSCAFDTEAYLTVHFLRNGFRFYKINGLTRFTTKSSDKGDFVEFSN